MRIAVLTPEFVHDKPSSGGLGSFLSRLVPELANAGHEVIILYPDRAQKKENLFYRGATIMTFPIVTPAWLNVLRACLPSLDKGPEGGAIAKLRVSWSFAKALEAEDRRKRIDLVHATNLSSSSLFVKRRRDRPVILRSSSDRKLWFQADRVWHGPGAWLIDFMETLACKRAQLVYAPSRFLTRRLAAKGIAAQYLPPPAPVSAEPTRADAGNREQGRYFIHFGALGRRKGTETLVDALPAIVAECPDFKMIWAGKEVQPGFVRDAKRGFASFDQYIQWLGPVPRDRLSGLVASAEWAILPSIVDNTPNTVLEALALGTPVLGTRETSIDEWVFEGKNGWLATPDDPEALGALITRLWKRQLPALAFRPDAYLSIAAPFKPEVFQTWRDDLVARAK